MLRCAGAIKHSGVGNGLGPEQKSKAHEATGEVTGAWVNPARAVRLPWVLTFRPTTCRHEVEVIGSVHVNSDPTLAEVAGAFDSQRLFFRSGQSWQQHGCQDGDDRDDDQ